MAGISRLLEIFRQENKDPGQLFQSLRSDAAGQGLRSFLSILRHGIGSDGEGKLGFEGWSRPQIEATVSVAKLIIAASVAAPVEHAEAVVLAIIENSLELCTCLLERSKFEGDDTSFQNGNTEVLEIALVGGKDFEACKLFVNTVEESLPTTADLGFVELNNYAKCNIQGVDCLKKTKPVDRVLMALASECLQPDYPARGFTQHSLPKSLNSIMSLSQHWAVVHVKCLPRLLILAKELLIPPSSSRELTEDVTFCLRLSFSLRILKLLVSLTKDVPVVDFDVDLLRIVSCLADSLPVLFKLEAELECESSTVQNSLGSLLLSLLEEFLQFVHIVFCEGVIFQNVRTAIIASALDALGSSLWRSNRSSSSLKVPVVYCPQIVMHLLKLIQDVKKETSQILNWKEKFDMDPPDSLSNSESRVISCHAHSEDVYLLRYYTCEEHLRIIFPLSRQWVDDLVHLVLFLHSEGVRSRLKVERLRPTCTKPVVSDLDSVTSHEEEAIFGDLFSEASRPTGSSDGHDQPPVTASGFSSGPNMPIIAAAELLNFLKLCIFSPDWHHTVYDDACKKVNEHHIDCLLSILLCQSCVDDKPLQINCALSSQRTFGHVNEICFELLHNLLVRHALSSSLEEHLVDEILMVNNGKFAYNDHTLTLLAHALISKAGMTESHLASKIYRSYVNFIIERTKDILNECPDLSDFLGTLPCIFHIEILLMAFHLANEVEKAALARSISLALREINGLPDRFCTKQLSCWALLVSRLVLVLRHMVLHPSTSPSWLLVKLRSKLREASSRVCFSHDCNDNTWSWVSIAAVNILGDCVNELPVVNGLLPHLIDVATLPALFCGDYDGFQQLGLNHYDLFATFSWILGFWNGKKAEALEDLLLERYIFMLCWDTGICVGSFCSPLKLQSEQEIHVSIADSFLNFGYFLLNQSSIQSEGADLSEALTNVLHLLHSTQGQVNTAELGWDFSRNGSWLALALSILHAGIWMLSVRNAVSGVDSLWIDDNAKDCKFFNSAEATVLSIIKACGSGWLLNFLSSCLKKQLQVLQEAFLSVIDDKGCFADEFSCLLLLKHVLLDRCRQNELLEKCGSDISQLDSIFCLLSKLDEVAIKENTGIRTRVLCRCLLHGFPSHSKVSSGLLLSCILTVRDIIYTLDELLKITCAGGNAHADAGVVHEILDSITSIKSDMIFQSVHGKCESIYVSLKPSLKGNLDYSYLFELKHILDLLAEINSTDVIDGATRETLIITALDKVDGLRRDPSKAEVFKFLLGTGQNACEEMKEYFGGQCVNLLVFVHSLDKCCSETVNLKVFNFFIDLLNCAGHPGLTEGLQKKFLEIDLLSLSLWLEKRLLGCTVESAGAVISKESSTALREATMNFVTCLICQPCEMISKGLRNQFVEAMLMSLDNAFTLYDISTAKAFFSFLVQLLSGESSMRQFLERIMLLIEKLADREDLLQGLKFLFGFLGTVLGGYGANKNASDKVSGKLSSSGSFGAESLVSRQISRKNLESLILPHNQRTDSANVDCDATSADEDDDDDGTSDGELASVDKEEEDDSNSERALASQVCTFTSSGSNFMEQHWYFCYTCDLTVSKGCCSVCAKVCHRGHRVVYSRSSRFFCDCGAGGVRGSSCQCLKTRKFTSSSNSAVRHNTSFRSLLPFSEDGDQTPDSDSDLDDDAHADTDSFKLFIPKEVQDVLPTLLEEIDTERHVLGLCSKLLPAVISRRHSHLSKDKKVALGDIKVLSYNTDIFQLRKAFKSGSFDLKVKAEYTNSRDLKSHLISGSLVKSLFSSSARGKLAVGEGDKVAIFDASQLVGQPTVAPVTADKTSVKPLSRNLVRFEIVHIVFNPIVESYLAVAGYEECQVLTVNSRGEVTDRLAIELALQGAYIRRVDWVPGSQVHLLVVTNMFVKIYDLSQDNISPIHYFTLTDDLIVDATLVAASMGRVCLLVLSELGLLYRLELSMEGDAGVKPLKDIVQVQERDVQPKGLSLYFSPVLRLLFLSYQDGITLIGRLDVDAMSLTEVSAVYEDEQDGKIRPAGLHHWRELLVDSGVFICFSSLKANAALAVSLGPHELVAQNMRYTSGSALPLVGITAYKPLSKDKSHCLALQDDGSLQIYSHIPVGTDPTANLNLDKAKKLGAGILNSKGHAGMNTDFPLDFFEKTICITSEVKLSGDAIKNNDSEGAKQRLQSDDGFLESPSSSGFKITVSNPNPDIVMVGIRIQVGNTSVGHIPSDVTIFQRIIKFVEGMRSWYDIPFTTAESLLADEEFTISIGPTFDGSTLPRIDSLEIYGRAKDEFGWKEKMDAVLNMEAHVLGSSYGSAGVRKKCQMMQAASAHEQVLSDALKLLSRLYLSCRSWTCSEIEEAQAYLNKLRSKELLEAIFQSDRELLLQSSACWVLKAIFPKKEIYYHVKDTLRLLGVISALPKLRSRIGIGSAASGWAIKEFMAQLRAVSRIALHRRSNMVSFLETHGSGVVDGLMEVLWGILDLERPDTQTINSIVIPSVELIYSYAECLASQGCVTSGCSVAAAVILIKKLLFAPYEAVQTASSLALSSRLLQVPFPKQTMLAADDVAENPGMANMPSDMAAGTGGNSHIMIEEDSNTSSVQYCCDGCSTVPILRRRWHCNVCPDFDLCETCYEVMDAEQLPPPHSKDHPMSAIPIEIDSVGGEGRGIHFTMDELSDASLMQVAGDINMQNSPSSIHILDSNESGELSTSMNQRIVSISASKRAVNSLLLQQLIVELKGWMETTYGFQGIPVMQLFYRLFSAVSASFMDSSKPENLDLEKIVKWFLDEINVNKPFSAKTRTGFGEVVILVFMFFTLMLRNWHQPGSESSQLKSAPVIETPDKGSCHIPLSSSIVSSSNDDQEKNEFASQLAHACSSLRQQAFVNYLMDILQQLVQQFKSSHVDVESSRGLSPGSGCGSLLTIRKELPAGNFSPFFSDSYAKAHRTDLFMDYHRLLLENTFRLVYSLVRPEKHDKCLVKEKTYRSSAGKELKLDGCQDVLCSYICNPHTSFVRRYARRLLLHVCGSKTQYYNVRDSWQFSNEVRKLYKLVNKSGGFQIPVPYERSVKLIKCLSAMSEVAGARPRNWQKYCIKHGDVLSFLMDGIFNFSEESVIQTLKLLSLAFYTGKDITPSILKAESGDGVGSNKAGSQSSDSKKKRKVEDGNETGSEKPCLDMEQAVGIFCVKEGSVLRHFIDFFLLEWNSTSLRAEAKCVLYGVWHHGKKSFKETLLTALLQKVKILPMYGQNIVEYTELLTSLLGKVPDVNGKQHETELVNQCLMPDVVNNIFDTLHSRNELLANHPNSRIYSTLSGLVEFDGYYLESEPCVACSCPEVPYSRMKLESLKSETKFTDNRIIVKCTGSYTIQTVTMNVHDARKSRSVKVLNLYYNNTPVADLSELKNNWSLWKRAKSCHLAFNQTELKVEFPIPITACNFMIELDSFYESLQASSLESLQCPRCSRSVTDKHGICSNCHENAYQCRQCRNINYENLDSFLCNECGYSKYGRFEFNFMAKPSFAFDNIENDEDMKKVLAAIESESENAHRRYQQLLGFKKPLLKLVSSIGEHEIDSQQKDTVQQMMVSLPGPSCKINRKIALLGVLYGEKCKGAFDSVSKSVQTLQGLRRVLMTYLSQKSSDKIVPSSRLTVSRSPNNCYGCAATFVTQCMELLQLLSKNANCRKQLVALGILSELFENNIHQGPKTARTQARAVLCAFSEGDANAVAELNILIQKKVMYCLEHHRSMDIAQATREELILLSETCALVDEFWEARLRVAFKLLFSSIKLGAKHPAISEHVILPCLRIISQACTPPKTDNLEKEQETGKSTSNLQPKNDQSNSSASLSKMTSDLPEKNWDGHKGQNIPLLSYSEWERGASYLDFVRRQYRISQAVKASKRSRQEPHRRDYLALKYALRWKCIACRRMGKTDFSAFELGSWISVLILSACSQSIRLEVCTLITLLCPQNSSRQFQLLNLLMMLLPASLSVGDSAAEYFELFFKMIGSEAARLFLTAKGCLTTICRLISQEVANVESQERSLNIDISQGFILHKLVELLSKFLEVPNIRIRFMHDELISEILEALLVIRGLIVQKTKLISDCNRLLKDLLDSLLLESSENKRHFIRACISGLQSHAKEQKGRTSLFILEQLCNVICPSKPEPVYLLNLNKAHTQEEFIRGSMTKNPYSSAEIGSLMRDVKNKICHQLDLLGLLEDDYGMELLVAGNIISLDLSISQVYEQVWKKSYTQSQNAVSNSALLSSVGFTSSSEFPPMTVTYRLQGLDGEATEPMIKELEEDREESQDPEVEFAIAGAVRECGGLEIILCMLQCLRDDQLKSNQEELGSVLNLLMYCCKIRENRRALLQLGALGLLLETARRAFSVDAMEPAEGILLIVESLTMEANESDIGITQSVLTVSNEETGAGDQAKKIVLMFLERLCHPSGMKKSNKQQRNNEMVARILPYLTYGEPAAMEALIQHFDPYLRDWGEFDCLQKSHQENPKYENLAQQAAKQRSAVENFVRVSESLKTSSCGGRLKDIILEKGITEVAVRHLRESFAVTGQAGFKSSAEWVHGLKLPSIPLILSMLRGISRGHLATQMCIDEGGILPLLHALEGVAGENEIGARAENLLDTLSDKERTGDGFLGEKVHKLRHATRDEMRRRALRKREELLQGLGMRQELASDGGERIVVSQPIIEGLDDVEEEEDGLACMVCREGYTLRPNDVLGVYSYTKRVNLGGGSTGNARGDCVYTTVSHFNIIHFQCHQEAKRADAALKNPKKEWEGATLRNNETLCNSIFPLRGPSVPLAQYVRYVDQFWENLNALGRADGSRLRLLTYDIVLMLARFATGASFSTDSRGGGRESNSRFLPFMVQMASHLLDQGGSNQPRRAMAKSVSAYLAASSSTLDSSTRPSVPPSGQRPSTGAADETVQFMMVNSLLSESYEDWAQHRLAFLQWGIYHAYMQHTHGRSTLRLSSDPGAGVVKSDAAGPSSDPSNRSKLFPIIQPMLVYMGMIEQLQRFFKLDKTAAGTGTLKQLQGEDGSGGGGGGLDGWEVVMKERLVNMKEMVSFSKEMLSWLEDMTSAGDVQEAFDVMGVLGDVLSGGYSHCEDFVQAAIAAGKS